MARIAKSQARPRSVRLKRAKACDTTSKIRVLTNASVDGYSRITDVEAWTVGALPAKVAAASSGASASASSTLSGYNFSAGAAIDGEHQGLNYYNVPDELKQPMKSLPDPPK
jgi:hypothetical protein